MSIIMQPDTLLSILFTLLLTMNAYFIKSLHYDFKRVVKELSDLKNSSALMHSETRSANEILKQRMEFFEWRLNGKEMTP